MSKKPDYNLSALDKDNSKSHKVGAAWKNPNGSISIAIDRFAVLSGADNMALTLFPNDGRRHASPAEPAPQKTLEDTYRESGIGKSSVDDPYDDDIPF